MTEEIDSELLACFLDEASDLLTQWERACLNLEQDPTEENINLLSRVAHSLKGAARVIGLEKFGLYIHKIEDLISKLLNAEISVSPQVSSLLLAAQASLSEWIAGLRTSANYEFNTDPITAEINRIITKSIDDKRSTNSPISSVSSIQENVAYTENLEPTKTTDLFQSAKHGIDATTEMTDKSIKKAGGSVSENRQTRSEESIRVSANKLDELLQLIGELSIHQAIINQGKREENLNSKICQHSIHLSAKITKDIHAKALSLRMQPLQGLFQRLERAARDVANLQNKRIKVITEGDDVELDRGVIEKVLDPLVHIVRNAIDHGIETTEERINAGKEAEAKLRIDASQDAAGVSLIVSDDGRGLNADKILAKAEKLGLISPGAKLANDDIYDLIFQPGFSTAENITAISGRGVGLDVVVKAVRELQGNVSIKSTPGWGTTFHITLPTSLSIFEALVVTLSDLKYAVPMHELTEIIDLSAYRIETSAKDNHIITIRGQVVPITKLKSHLICSTINESVNNDSAKSRPALLVREGKALVAFEIDNIQGQQQIVVRPLSEHLASIRGFTGCTILGDGEPGLILSLNEIAKDYLKLSSSREEVMQ